VSSNYGIGNCSINLPFKAQMHRQTHKVTDATDHPTHTSVNTGVGNNEMQKKRWSLRDRYTM